MAQQDAVSESVIGRVLGRSQFREDPEVLAAVATLRPDYVGFGHWLVREEKPVPDKGPMWYRQVDREHAQSTGLTPDVFVLEDFIGVKGAKVTEIHGVFVQSFSTNRFAIPPGYWAKVRDGVYVHVLSGQRMQLTRYQTAVEASAALLAGT